MTRGERNAWTIATALGVTTFAAALALVWTGDSRFGWTIIINGVAALVAAFVGAAFAGQRTKRDETIPPGPLTAEELARTEDD